MNKYKNYPLIQACNNSHLNRPNEQIIVMNTKAESSNLTSYFIFNKNQEKFSPVISLISPILRLQPEEINIRTSRLKFTPLDYLINLVSSTLPPFSLISWIASLPTDKPPEYAIVKQPWKNSRMNQDWSNVVINSKYTQYISKQNENSQTDKARNSTKINVAHQTKKQSKLQMSDVSQPKFFTKVTQIPGLPDIQKIMEEQKQQSAQKIHQKQSVSKFQQFFGSVTEQKQPSSQQQSQKQLQKPQQSPITSSQPPDPEIQFDPSITHISDNDSKSDSSLSVPNSPRHSPEMSQSLPSLPPMSPTSESRSSLKPLSPSLNSLPPISPIYSAQSQISPNLMQNFSTSPVDDLHSPRYFAEDMPNIIKNSYSSLKDAKHEQHDQYTQQDKAYIEEQLNEQEQGQEEEEELQRRDDEQLMDSERDREIIDSDKDREILYTDNERPQLESERSEKSEKSKKEDGDEDDYLIQQFQAQFQQHQQKQLKQQHSLDSEESRLQDQLQQFPSIESEYSQIPQQQQFPSFESEQSSTQQQQQKQQSVQLQPQQQQQQTLISQLQNNHRSLQHSYSQGSQITTNSQYPSQQQLQMKYNGKKEDETEVDTESQLIIDDDIEEEELSFDIIQQKVYSHLFYIAEEYELSNKINIGMNCLNLYTASGLITTQKWKQGRRRRNEMEQKQSNQQLNQQISPSSSLLSLSQSQYSYAKLNSGFYPGSTFSLIPQHNPLSKNSQLLVQSNIFAPPVTAQPISTQLIQPYYIIDYISSYQNQRSFGSYSTSIIPLPQSTSLPYFIPIQQLLQQQKIYSIISLALTEPHSYNISQTHQSQVNTALLQHKPQQNSPIFSFFGLISLLIGSTSSVLGSESYSSNSNSQFNRAILTTATMLRTPHYNSEMKQISQIIKKQLNQNEKGSRESVKSGKNVQTLRQQQQYEQQQYYQKQHPQIQLADNSTISNKSNLIRPSYQQSQFNTVSSQSSAPPTLQQTYLQQSLKLFSNRQPNQQSSQNASKLFIQQQQQDQHSHRIDDGQNYQFFNQQIDHDIQQFKPQYVLQLTGRRIFLDEDLFSHQIETFSQNSKLIFIRTIVDIDDQRKEENYDNEVFQVDNTTKSLIIKNNFKNVPFNYEISSLIPKSVDIKSITNQDLLLPSISNNLHQSSSSSFAPISSDLESGTLFSSQTQSFSNSASNLNQQGIVLHWINQSLCSPMQHIQQQGINGLLNLLSSVTHRQIVSLSCCYKYSSDIMNSPEQLISKGHFVVLSKLNQNRQLIITHLQRIILSSFKLSDFDQKMRKLAMLMIKDSLDSFEFENHNENEEEILDDEDDDDDDDDELENESQTDDEDEEHERVDMNTINNNRKCKKIYNTIVSEIYNGLQTPQISSNTQILQSQIMQYLSLRFPDAITSFIREIALRLNEVSTVKSTQILIRFLIPFISTFNISNPLFFSVILLLHQLTCAFAVDCKFEITQLWFSLLNKKQNRRSNIKAVITYFVYGITILNSNIYSQTHMNNNKSISLNENTNDSFKIQLQQPPSHTYSSLTSTSPSFQSTQQSSSKQVLLSVVEETFRQFLLNDKETLSILNNDENRQVDYQQQQQLKREQFEKQQQYNIKWESKIPQSPESIINNNLFSSLSLQSTLFNSPFNSLNSSSSSSLGWASDSFFYSSPTSQTFYAPISRVLSIFSSVLPLFTMKCLISFTHYASQWINRNKSLVEYEVEDAKIQNVKIRNLMKSVVMMKAFQQIQIKQQEQRNLTKDDLQKQYQEDNYNSDIGNESQDEYLHSRIDIEIINNNFDIQSYDQAALLVLDLIFDNSLIQLNQKKINNKLNENYSQSSSLQNTPNSFSIFQKQFQLNMNSDNQIQQLSVLSFILKLEEENISEGLFIPFNPNDIGYLHENEMRLINNQEKQEMLEKTNSKKKSMKKHTMHTDSDIKININKQKKKNTLKIQGPSQFHNIYSASVPSSPNNYREQPKKHANLNALKQQQDSLDEEEEEDDYFYQQQIFYGQQQIASKLKSSSNLQAKVNKKQSNINNLNSKFRQVENVRTEPFSSPFTSAQITPNLSFTSQYSQLQESQSDHSKYPQSNLYMKEKRNGVFIRDFEDIDYENEEESPDEKLQNYQNYPSLPTSSQMIPILILNLIQPQFTLPILSTLSASHFAKAVAYSLSLQEILRFYFITHINVIEQLCNTVNVIMKEIIEKVMLIHSKEKKKHIEKTENEVQNIQQQENQNLVGELVSIYISIFTFQQRWIHIQVLNLFNFFILLFRIKIPQNMSNLSQKQQNTSLEIQHQSQQFSISTSHIQSNTQTASTSKFNSSDSFIFNFFYSFISNQNIFYSQTLSSNTQQQINDQYNDNINNLHLVLILDNLDRFIPDTLQIRLNLLGVKGLSILSFIIPNGYSPMFVFEKMNEREQYQEIEQKIELKQYLLQTKQHKEDHKQETTQISPSSSQSSFQQLQSITSSLSSQPSPIHYVDNLLDHDSVHQILFLPPESSSIRLLKQYNTKYQMKESELDQIQSQLSNSHSHQILHSLLKQLNIHLARIVIIRSPYWFKQLISKLSMKDNMNQNNQQQNFIQQQQYLYQQQLENQLKVKQKQRNLNENEKQKNLRTQIQIKGQKDISRKVLSKKEQDNQQPKLEIYMMLPTSCKYANATSSILPTSSATISSFQNQEQSVFFHNMSFSLSLSSSSSFLLLPLVLSNNALSHKRYHIQFIIRILSSIQDVKYNLNRYNLNNINSYNNEQFENSFNQPSFAQTSPSSFNYGSNFEIIQKAACSILSSILRSIELDLINPINIRKVYQQMSKEIKKKDTMSRCVEEALKMNNNSYDNENESEHNSFSKMIMKQRFESNMNNQRNIRNRRLSVQSIYSPASNFQPTPQHSISKSFDWGGIPELSKDNQLNIQNINSKLDYLVKSIKRNIIGQYKLILPLDAKRMSREYFRRKMRENEMAHNLNDKYDKYSQQQRQGQLQVGQNNIENPLILYLPDNRKHKGNHKHTSQLSDSYSNKHNHSNQQSQNNSKRNEKQRSVLSDSQNDSSEYSDEDSINNKYLLQNNRNQKRIKKILRKKAYKISGIRKQQLANINKVQQIQMYRTSNIQAEQWTNSYLRRTRNIIVSLRAVLNNLSHSESQELYSQESQIQQNRSISINQSHQRNLNISSILPLFIRIFSIKSSTKIIRKSFAYEILRQSLSSRSSSKSISILSLLQSLSLQPTLLIFASLGFELFRSAMFPYQGAFSQFISIIKYFELLIEKASISILFQLPQLLWLCISLIRSTFVPIVYNGLHLLSAYLTRVIPLLSGSEQFREIIMNSIPLFAIETQYLTDNENQTENEKIRNIFNWGNKYPVFVGIRYFVFPSLFHKLTEKLARDILIQMSLLPQSCNPIIDPYSVVDNKGSFTILCCSILPFLCNAIDNFSEVVSFLQSPFYSQQTNEKANYFSDQRHNLLYNQQFTDITNNEVRQDSQFSEQKQPNNQPYLFKNRADPLLQRSFSSNTSLHELNYRKVKNLVQQSSPSLSASYTFAQKSSLKQSGIIRETEFRSNYISSLPANYLFNLFNYQTNIINDEEQIVNDELPAQTLRQQVESTLIEARETAQLLALGALNQQQGTLALILQLYSRAHFNNSSEFLEAIAPSICEELDSSEIVSFELDNIPVFEQRKQGVSMIVYTLWMRQLYGASEYSTVRSIYNIIFAFLIHKEQQALRLSHVVYQILDERKWEMIREENQMMNQEDVIEREQDSNDNQNPSPATHHSPFQQQIQTQLQKQGINRISQKLLQPQNKKQLTEAQKQGNQQNKQQVSVVSDVFSASVGSASTSSSYALQSQVINQLKNASTSIQPQQNTYDSQLHGNQTLRAPKISSLFPELQPKTPNSAQSSPGQNYQSLAQLGTSPNLSVFEKDVAKIGDSNQLGKNNVDDFDQNQNIVNQKIQQKIIKHNLPLIFIEPKLGLLLTTSLRANMQTPIRLYAARLFSASVRATSSFMKKDINSQSLDQVNKMGINKQLNRRSKQSNKQKKSEKLNTDKYQTLAAIDHIFEKEQLFDPILIPPIAFNSLLNKISSAMIQCINPSYQYTLNQQQKQNQINKINDMKHDILQAQTNQQSQQQSQKSHSYKYGIYSQLFETDVEESTFNSLHARTFLELISSLPKRSKKNETNQLIIALLQAQLLRIPKLSLQTEKLKSQVYYEDAPEKSTLLTEDQLLYNSDKSQQNTQNINQLPKDQVQLSNQENVEIIQGNSVILAAWLGLTPDNLPYQLTDVTSEKSTMEKLFIIQKAVKQMCICEMDPSISIAFGIKALTDIVGDIIVEVFKQYGKRNQKSKTVQSENRKQQITRKSEKYKKNTLQSFIWTDQTYAEWFLRFISQYSFLESNIIDETKMHDCRTTGTYEKKYSILKGNTLSLEIKLEDEWNRQLEQLWAKFDSLANLNLQDADKIWREAIDLREFAEYQIVNNLVQTLR